MKQRTEEWHEVRSGRITASRFGDVLARPSSKRYRYYMDDLVESLQGFPRIEKYTPWFDHGNELEDRGKGLYEWMHNVEIKDFSFIHHPKYFFIGCSPDGLIGEYGGIELKSRLSYKEHQRSERLGLPSEHKPQVQGSLWITGREWWDFVSYYHNHGKRLLFSFRVYPDLEYHKRLEYACLDFWNKANNRI